jgi:YidC/Oxa1 family membrane protein insertase
LQALQPKVKELQEKHKGGDRVAMQKELTELYRAEKANPLMGCLPMFLQIPVFLGLFHVLKRLRPGREEHWKVLYGWTAGQFDSASAAKLLWAPISANFRTSAPELAVLGANPTAVKLVAGLLIAIMIVTTFLTSRQMILKTGWSTEPQQRMVQRLMLYGVPFSLLISGTLFPIGVVIYWVTTNVFSLGQQFWVLRKYPPPPQPTTAGKPATARSGTANGKAGPTVKTSFASRFGGLASLIGLSDKAGSAAKPNASRAGGKAKADEAKPVADGRALAPRPGAKPNLTKGGKAKAEDSKPVVDGRAPAADGRAPAPRPGARPIKPKKGGTARRRSG